MQLENNASRIPSNDLRKLLKIIDSLLMFCDLKKWTVSDTRENCQFILVYNPEVRAPSSREEIHFYMERKKARERYVPFDLDPLMLYFSDVIAYDSEEFDDFLKQVVQNG